MSNFDDVAFVSIVLQVSARSLYKGAYSATQQWLFERVRSLREDRKLTFAAIAARLTKFGVKSARGKVLCAEHVFSIYKKGNKRKIGSDYANDSYLLGITIMQILFSF